MYMNKQDEYRLALVEQYGRRGQPRSRPLPPSLPPSAAAVSLSLPLNHPLNYVSVCLRAGLSHCLRAHPLAMCLEQTGSASAAAFMAEIKSGSESMQRINDRLSLTCHANGADKRKRTKTGGGSHAGQHKSWMWRLLGC